MTNQYRPTNQEATHSGNLRPETRPWTLPELTVYITDSCSLSCTGCITYNNFALGSHLRLEDARERIDVWSKLVRVEHLYVIGGEPLSHPELDSWISYLDSTFDSPRKTIVTNGRGLEHRTQAVAGWLELGWDLEVSSHSKEDYDTAQSWWQGMTLELLATTVAERRVDDSGVTDYWADSDGQPLIQIGLRTNFYKPDYEVVEGQLSWPKLNNPRTSHKNCPGKDCTHLVNGIMYRCPVQATLPRLAQRFEIQGPAQEIAQRDLGYDPLAQNKVSLSTWMNTLDQPTEQCRLCSWPRERAAISDPGLKKVHLVRRDRGSPTTAQEPHESPADV